jgi:dTDP-4-dehydrorhamnose reductase
MLKILVTGATGRLGKYIVPELRNSFEVEAVGIENWDIIYPFPKGKYDLVVHMAAWTDVRKAEAEANKCFLTNAFGTFNIMKTYKDTPLVYISTEYANKPLGVYALSKRLGEEIVKTHPHHLIIRTSFKPTPFPFPKAYADQFTQGDYIDIMAGVIADKIKSWDRETCEFTYCGTGRKTMLELARRTRPDVTPNSVDDYNKEIGMNLIPKDYL